MISCWYPFHIWISIDANAQEMILRSLSVKRKWDILWPNNTDQCDHIIIWCGAWLSPFTLSCHIWFSSYQNYLVNLYITYVSIVYLLYVSCKTCIYLHILLCAEWHYCVCLRVGNLTSNGSSHFIPNRIQQYNTECMPNITNCSVIIDIVMWFCWWPPKKPRAYQAGSHWAYQAGSHKLHWVVFARYQP